MDQDAVFYDQVLSRVVRYYEHGSYGKNTRNAARALRQKYPHLTLDECEDAFLKVLAVYEEAIALVEDLWDEFWDVYKKTRGRTVVPERVALSFAQKHPSLPESVTRGMLSWIFFWHHLK